MINGMTLFFIQMPFSFLIYAIIAVWYVYPRLKGLPQLDAVVPLIWIHAFRNVGLSVLAPGAAPPEVPASVFTQLGYGDLAVATFALITLFIIRSQQSWALGMVWIFNIFALGDMMLASAKGAQVNAFNYPMGANWLVATMYVPLCVVSSLMIFVILLKKDKVD